MYVNLTLNFYRLAILNERYFQICANFIFKLALAAILNMARFKLYIWKDLAEA